MTSSMRLVAFVSTVAAALVVVGASAGPAAGAYVTPTVADFSSQIDAGGIRDAVHTVDGSGLLGPDTEFSHAAHSSGEGVHWTTKGGVQTPNDQAPFITYDLGSVANVTGIHVWNGNQEGGDGFGPYTQEAPRLVDIFAGTGLDSLSLAGRVTFLPGTGDDTYTGDDVADLPALEGVQFVRFQFVDTYDNAVFPSADTTFAPGDRGRYLVNLSEVRFSTRAVPEPASALVMLLGGLGVLVRRRRGTGAA